MVLKFLLYVNLCLYIFQASSVIESAAETSKEVESRPSQALGDHTPSHPATSEPEKADRAERPPSSEYKARSVCTVADVYVSFFTLLSSVIFFNICLKN